LTDDVIALLNEKFVCLAPGWATGDDPKAKDGEYEWWKEVRRAKNIINGVGIDEATIPGTMFWVATSAGERVPARKAQSSKQTGLARTLQQVLRLYAELPEARRRPDKPIEDTNRPRAAPPPGGLVLISYDRPLFRDDQGKYHALTGGNPQTSLTKHIPWQPGAQLDALWLTRAECESLMPKNPQEGQTFSVPAALTRRIGLFGLTVRSAWQEMYHWTPDSVRRGDLKLTIESVSPTGVAMRLHGSILLSAIKRNWHPEGVKEGRDIEDRYDAHLEGQLVYDPTTKRLTRWDMVALGDYTGFSQAHLWAGKELRQREDFGLAKEPVAIGISFEIDNNNYDLPAEYRRSIPHVIWWLGDRSKEHDWYFDPRKWEEEWKKRNKN
jgi:hypothetical protein